MSEEVTELKKYKPYRGKTTVRGIRANQEFFDLVDKAAIIQCVSRNQLILDVMTVYCKGVLKIEDGAEIELEEKTN